MNRNEKTNEGNYIRVTQMKVVQERVTLMKATQNGGNTNKRKANEGNAD